MTVACNQKDIFWMQHALSLAKKALSVGEVPVGAVLVLNDQLIGEGYNTPILHHDPTAHAEIMAIRDAAKKINNYRLPDTTLYVTLEPCMMCAAALIHARIKHLVFGAPDSKAGAIVSQAQILDYPFFNHKVTYQCNILSSESSLLLKSFFQEKRSNNKTTLPDEK